MGFLQRSKSMAAVQQAEKKKDIQPAVHREGLPRSRGGQSITSCERPRSPNRQRSFSRPRTANAAIERSADLHIFSQTIEIKSGDDIFRFPTPSPRLAPRSATFPRAQPSPLSVGSSPKIGVAIGSPSQAKPNCSKSNEAGQVQYRAPAQPPPARSPPAIPKRLISEEQRPDLRKKKSSWKTFGSLFGRKTAKAQVEEPFYKLKLSHEHPDLPASKLSGHHMRTVVSRPMASPAPTPSPLSTTHTVRRTPSITRGLARLEARAEADREAFSRDGRAKTARSPSMIQKSGFSPMFDSFRRVSEDFFKGEDEPRRDSPLSIDATPERLAIPRTPRLDLDIPTPTFDRYSVMFEQVLDPRDQRKPSILERRQSKLQRNRSTKMLETVFDESGLLETVESGASSASDKTATPPFSKKALSITVNGVNRPRPIQRSKTAPPAAISPRSPNPRISVAARSPGAHTITEGSLPPTPMTFATISDNGSIAVINNDLRQTQRKNDQSEPTWDMLTSYDRSSPYLRVKSPEDLERQIVQVSVARQVSVTKARKQVERAVPSKQPLRPKVVDLGNRKSTVVIIESGDD